MSSPTSVTHTTCPYCGVGCGVEVTQHTEQPEPVAGLQTHPSNYGRLCVKGSSLHDTLDHTDRLLHPMLNGQQTTWDKALNLVADKIQQVISTHGPDAVAFYGSGQLLTEDYYVANKLMKGFIGSANMDTNSRLCMASAVAAYKRSLGSDTVPGSYHDLEQADLLVITGSNAAWAHPILFQRMAAAKQANPDMKVVVIDPRKTATCDLADLHIQLKPGTDTTLFNALLTYLHEQDAFDKEFVENYCEQLDDALEAAAGSARDFADLSAQVDVPEADLETFFHWFRDTEKTVSFYSQGVNQSTDGTDKANSIINLHLATGRIGKPGACPFSITGQPNAMGGREVGGLANQLAAHMDFSADDRDRVKRFWNSPGVAERPGYKAVDLFDAVKDGKVKFLWIMSTNPLVSMPDADDVKEAMKQCELVVVSDCMANTDTTAAAHVLLPAASWGEKNGTVTNSERRISRQRGFLPSPGEAKPDWWIISQVAQRMGYPAEFNYDHPYQIFDEHTRLSGFENDGTRDFDLSALSGMDQTAYDAMAPVQWPVNARYPNGRERFYDDGRFYTPNRKARFVPVQSRIAPLSKTGLNMNTGRVRDHWHTMTRTAKAPVLARHIMEPYADFHPDDANELGIQDQQLVRLFSERGDIIVRAQVRHDGAQRRHEVFVPMHWTGRYASRARMGTLINKDHDPISGQPALKISDVQAEPFQTDWEGFLLTADDLGPLNSEYWVYNVTDTGHMYDISGQGSPDDLIEEVRQHFNAQHWLHFSDPANTHYRFCLIEQGRLRAVLFIHKEYDFGSRQWLIERFGDVEITDQDRRALLAGKPLGAQEDKGAIVCSCFQVGENSIKDAIAQGCETPAELGEALKCGTNCGSCIPELKSLISATLATEAVE